MGITLVFHTGTWSEFHDYYHSQSVVMPTKFSGSRDLSVNQQVALAARNTSTSSSPPTLVATASSFASLKPGADVRRRLQQQPPGLVRPPVSWDPAGHYTNSGQTNGQGFMSRKSPYFQNKYNTETFVGHLWFDSYSAYVTRWETNRE
jgi:hypothetical protein